MTLHKKILLSTLFLMTLTVLIIYLSSLKEQIVYFLFPLCFLLPAFFISKQMKHLQSETERMEAERIKNIEQIKKLEKDMHMLQASRTELISIIDHMDGLLFSCDVQTRQWIHSSTFIKFFGKEHKLSTLLDKYIHPEDKKQFIKQKEKWLTGSPTIVDFRIILENEEIRSYELRANTIKTTSGEVEKIVGLLIDITARKEKEEKLAQMAFYDALTELPNRALLKSHLKKVMARAKRKEHEFTIMFIDLDGFKEVNDTLGHDIGDALLKEVAHRLNRTVREEDFISRLGGDEFIIILEDTRKEDVTSIGDRIITNISQPYPFSEKEAIVTPSIGIANYPDDGEDIHSLVQNADKAMYHAKNIGKNNFQFYTTDLKDYQPQESLIDKVLKFFLK
ncbi:diguanylate cyclase (GGDEF)-like protein [Cytobacillus eiseniae]|uniref:Diguanylate cyclase (GGDEF)-like protein n=1 Tax=Cytobacillus eiseniae TaxID=762947 RepID=A0ABS4RCC8_9BACI|nr:diguanylate cyclase [Cytobacillus eiseniae]MBP2240383.1 diguanylate cyclase (GGDEF)-like protein [Cytobacillus eiseniae]